MWKMGRELARNDPAILSVNLHPAVQAAAKGAAGPHWKGAGKGHYAAPRGPAGAGGKSGAAGKTRSYGDALKGGQEAGKGKACGREGDELPMGPFVGYVKSFSAERGWGRIECFDARSIFGKDVFLHRRAIQGHSGPVHDGDRIKFFVRREVKGPAAQEAWMLGPGEDGSGGAAADAWKGHGRNYAKGAKGAQGTGKGKSAGKGGATGGERDHAWQMGLAAELRPEEDLQVTGDGGVEVPFEPVQQLAEVWIPAPS